MKEFDSYQEATRLTAIYPKEKALEYLVLGLCSEAGEVAGKLKKTIRKDKKLSTIDMAHELGDVLWYLARIADELGIDLSYIATINIEKLLDRKNRGKIKGDGDRR